MEHIAELFNTATEDFFLHCQQHGITDTPLSKHTLATCTLFRLLLTAQKPAAALIFRFAPTLRLLANFKRECGKQYTPQDACGEDVELAASRLPAYFSRLADSAEQPVPSSSSAAYQPAAAASDLMLPVASPPVMCWICGEGFTHNGAFYQHCTDAHGGYAEYRKRLLWRAQQDGFKPLLPWVKRHILQSATFHLTFSVPGSLSLCIGIIPKLSRSLPRGARWPASSARRRIGQRIDSLYIFGGRRRTRGLTLSCCTHRAEPHHSLLVVTFCALATAA